MKFGPEYTGLRMDRAIAERLSASGQQVSVSETKAALKAGSIKVNGRFCAPGTRVQENDDFQLDSFVPKSAWTVKPAPELLCRSAILYEDDDWLALDKPSGVHTVPLKNLEEDTLLGAAIARDERIAQSGPTLEGGALHRLDYGTSGVVLFAKKAAGRALVREAFDRHEVKKEYLAVVLDETAVWTSPRRVEIALDTNKRRVRPAEDGLLAVTNVNLVRRNESGHTLLCAETQYGRRHQIRVHLATCGTPILGDEVYGDVDTFFRLALHASKLTLPSGLSISAPMSQDLGDLLL